MSKKEIHIGDGDRIKIERPFPWSVVVIIVMAFLVVGGVAFAAVALATKGGAPASPLSTPPPTSAPVTAVLPTATPSPAPTATPKPAPLPTVTPSPTPSPRPPTPLSKEPSPTPMPVPARFNVEVYAALSGAPGDIAKGRPQTALNVVSNIFLSKVTVDLPDGRTISLPPYSDIYYSKNVYRYHLVAPTTPTKGGVYIFTGWGADGSLVAKSTDTYLGFIPEPPASVNASVTVAAPKGIRVSWGESPTIPGAFEPQKGRGNYQLRVWSATLEKKIVSSISIVASSALIPLGPSDNVTQPGLAVREGSFLSELTDGTYKIQVFAISRAPERSVGKGSDAQSSNSDEDIFFTIKTIGGEKQITILPGSTPTSTPTPLPTITRTPVPTSTPTPAKTQAPPPPTPPPATPVPATATPIPSSKLVTGPALTYGNIVSGDINPAGEIDTYSFEGKMGEVVLIMGTQTSSRGGYAYDLRLELFDPQGRSVKKSSASGFDQPKAKITTALPINGRYSVAIDKASARSDTYTLALHNVRPGIGKLLAYGQVVSADITPAGDLDMYTFQGTVGDVVLVAGTQTSSYGGYAYDLRVEFFDPMGQSISSAQANGFDQPKANVNATLIVNGTYSIAVEKLSPRSDSYTLSLKKLNN